MKFYVLAFGVALVAAFAPVAASAQNFLQGSSDATGFSAAPDTDAVGRSLNPFTGAAGADRYIQDDTTGGLSGPNTSNTSGNSTILNNFIGGDAADNDSNSGN